MNKNKIDIINKIFSEKKFKSFADLGGVWGVEGGYTYHILSNFDINASFLVDTNITEIVKNKSSMHSSLTLIEGNFGDEKVYNQLPQVDLIILFDVLLHQVNPDWDEILEIYSKKADHFLIYNQQWIRGSESIRLLDLGEVEYFNNTPHERDFGPYRDLFKKLDELNISHNRLWRNVHNIWQWGITNQSLLSKLDSLGFELQYYENCGDVHNLQNFENRIFLFSKK